MIVQFGPAGKPSATAIAPALARFISRETCTAAIDHVRSYIIRWCCGTVGERPTADFPIGRHATVCGLFAKLARSIGPAKHFDHPHVHDPHRFPGGLTM